jgi:predicted LPLAT superfamily acyltransferase
MTRHWDEQRERSTRFMLYWLASAALIFGRPIIRIVLLPIVAYFLLTSPRAVRASKHALRRLLGRRPTRKDVARHFYSYAACGVDRLYFLRDRHRQFRITTHRPQNVLDLANSGRGCLLLVAHMGSFECMRFLGTTQRKLPLSILLDREQGKKMMGLLERLNPTLATQLIDASLRGPELVLKLKESLQAGRMVCMMGDRARANERAFEVPFVDRTVRMPEGPWSLATALGVPVILGFGLYQGSNRYDVYFELFAERITSDRRSRAQDLKAWTQRYAARLEHYARLAPYNWFNFYDYWGDDTSSADGPNT